MSAQARALPPLGTLTLLSALYFVQGLPFGFQENALGPFLRAEGLSRTAVALAGALSLPWLLEIDVTHTFGARALRATRQDDPYMVTYIV